MTTTRRAGLGQPRLAAPSLACAQAFPARPVRIVVPYPAGGGMDVLARALADWLPARRLRALAIGRDERLPSLPHVPRLREAGFPAVDPRPGSACSRLPRRRPPSSAASGGRWRA
jgi:tripartite-type tricarboxylate transporter receptor subunit TctC